MNGYTAPIMQGSFVRLVSPPSETNMHMLMLEYLITCPDGVGEL
jgi:hypothetical protein